MDNEVTLAERKRKKKWSLNPRGKFWTDDENKIGQKMLEKMGWSKGKGLGATEQGRADPISVNSNNDNRGLGFEGNPEQWLSHQEDFENLLASLNASSNSEEASKSKSKKPQSLEERSKSMKTRVHYHKFTRGKDLSNWKESDHACIFGKKSKKKEFQDEDPSKTEDKVGSISNQHGVTVIKGESMADYFSRKWIVPKPSATREHRDSSSDTEMRPSFLQEIKAASDSEEDMPRQSFSQKIKASSDSEEDMPRQSFSQKMKASSDSEEDIPRPSFSQNVTLSTDCEERPRPSFGFQSSAPFMISSGTNHSGESKPKSKKKKHQHVTPETDVVNDNQETETSALDEKRKSKKRKHKDRNKGENNVVHSETSEYEVLVERKKRKKNKHFGDETGDGQSPVERKSRKKKKKKEKEKEEQEACETKREEDNYMEDHEKLTEGMECKKKKKKAKNLNCSAETPSLISSSSSLKHVQVF